MPVNLKSAFKNEGAQDIMQNAGIFCWYLAIQSCYTLVMAYSMRYIYDESVKQRLYAGYSARRAIVIEAYLKYKASHPCACGESDPRVLCFPKRPDLRRGFDCGILKSIKLLDGAKVSCLNCMCAQRRIVTGSDYESRRRLLLQELKAVKGCAYCGYRNGAALDYHHIDPSTKTTDVSRLVCKSMNRVYEEIEKCEVVCQNCHIKHHNS